MKNKSHFLSSLFGCLFGAIVLSVGLMTPNASREESKIIDSSTISEPNLVSEKYNGKIDKLLVANYDFVQAEAPSSAVNFKNSVDLTNTGISCTLKGYSFNQPGNQSLHNFAYKTDGVGTDTTYYEWNFGWNYGLTFDVDQDFSKDYTIAMRFSLHDLSGGWRKIVDYRNYSSDNGFYFTNSHTKFYPDSAEGVATYKNDEIIDFIITRNGTTNVMSVYTVVDGVKNIDLVYSKTVDNSKGYVSDGHTIFGFLRDDTQNREYSKAVKIYSLKFFNYCLSEDDAMNAANPMKVTYDLNGGTSTPEIKDDTVYKENDTVAISDTIPVLQGKTIDTEGNVAANVSTFPFIGWRASNGEIYNSRFIISSPTTLYAVYGRDVRHLNYEVVRSYIYNGTAITPEPIIRTLDLTTTLVKGTDYDLSYSNNINVGTAKITITFKNTYITGDYVNENTTTNYIDFEIKQRPLYFKTLTPKDIELSAANAVTSCNDFVATNLEGVICYHNDSTFINDVVTLDGSSIKATYSSKSEVGSNISVTLDGTGKKFITTGTEAYKNYYIAEIPTTTYGNVINTEPITLKDPSATHSDGDYWLVWSNLETTFNGLTQNPVAKLYKMESGTQITVADSTNTEKTEITFSGSGINAGEYTVTASISLYKVASESSSYLQTKFLIKQVVVSFVWTDTAFDYDGTAHTLLVSAVYKSDPTKDASVSVNIKLKTGDDNINVGKFTYVVDSLKDAINFMYESNEPTQTCECTISAKNVASNSDYYVSWTGGSYVYKATEQKPTAKLYKKETGGASDTLIDDGLTLTLIGSTSSINAGTYHILATSSKYTLDSTQSDTTNVNKAYLTYTIAQEEVSLTWTAPSDLHYVLGGVAKTPTVAVGNLESGDSCTATIALNSGDNINVTGTPFTFKATALSNANYKLPTNVISGEYTITKYSPTSMPDASSGLHIVWSNTSLAYNGLAQKPTAKLYANDTFLTDLVVTTGSDAISADTYSATASDTASIHFPTGGNTSSFEITRRVVSLTWSTEKYYYDGTAKVPTVTVGNLVNGEAVAVATELNSGDNVNKGTFTYKVSGFIGDSAVNYALPTNVISPTYTIGTPLPTPKPTIEPVGEPGSTSGVYYIIWKDTTFVYDAKEHRPTATLYCTGSDFKEELYISVKTTGKDVGTYYAYANSSEFALAGAYATKEFTITPKVLGLTWSTPSVFNYDGTAHIPSVTLDGIISGDTCEATIALASGSNTNVGTFTYKVVSFI